jgi:hypothetical protein
VTTATHILCTRGSLSTHLCTEALPPPLLDHSLTRSDAAGLMDLSWHHLLLAGRRDAKGSSSAGSERQVTETTGEEGHTTTLSALC